MHVHAGVIFDTKCSSVRIIDPHEIHDQIYIITTQYGSIVYIGMVMGCPPLYHA